MKYPSLWRIVAVLASNACLSPALAAATKGRTGGSYTVKSGDTFAKIARANGVGLGELLTANRIANPDRILLGQKIVIPGSKTAPPKAVPVKQPPRASIVSKPRERTSKQLPLPDGRRHRAFDETTVNLTPPSSREGAAYIVQSGDTLNRIQRRTGVPVSALLKLNGLTEASIIHPGQKLRVPASGSKMEQLAQQRPARRTVRDDDTPVIMDINRESPDGPPPADRPVPPAPTGTAPHKVESGETFSSISRLYGVSSDRLASANRNVDPNRIRIGQTLMVPGQPLKPQPKPLMVRADGRILAGRPDPLAIGGESDDEVPANRTRTGYLVQEGETIQQIAQRFYTTEGVVRRLNRMGDSDNVYAGRYILVPFIRQAPQPPRYANRDA